MAADSVTCSGCASTLKLPAQATPGKTIRCPKCGTMMPLPLSDPAVQGAAAPAAAPEVDLHLSSQDKEEFAEGEILERMQGLRGHRIRADKKRQSLEPPHINRSSLGREGHVEPPPAPRAPGRFVLVSLLLFLVFGLVAAGALAAYLRYFRNAAATIDHGNSSAGQSSSDE